MDSSKIYEYIVYVQNIRDSRRKSSRGHFDFLQTIVENVPFGRWTGSEVIMDNLTSCPKTHIFSHEYTA